MSTQIEAVVIGGSAGALEVLGGFLPTLPRDFGLPILLVLHLLPKRPSHLVGVLAARTPLAVKEAEDKEPLLPGTLYVAPPNYHLLVERDRAVALSVDAPVNFSRPAIDVLFDSAAETFGPAVAALLLSGANNDGARGLAHIKNRGGLTAVQSPAAAATPTMPEAALRLGAADHVLLPAEISQFLLSLPARAGGTR